MLSRYIIEANEGKQPLGFYVPSHLAGRWGDEVYYRRRNILDKLYMRAPRGCRLWHTTYQLSRYVPHNVPMLLTVHDLNFLYEKEETKQAVYVRRLQEMVDRSQRIVTISQFTRDDLLAHVDVKGKRVDVIYNGCNVYRGEITAPAVIPQHDFIFTVATVLPKKNFHVLPCLLQGNDMEMIIAGNKSGYVDVILDEARRYGVEQRMKIVGPVKETEKHWYMQHCRAFVFPSVAEGFGLPVVEAMSYGKPVFLSQHTSLPEIGADRAYYFNRDFDRRAMQEEFRLGLDDYDRNKEQRSLQIKERAASFSWESTAAQYLQVYSEMAAK